MRRTLSTLAVIALVVLAGCAGSTPGGTTAPTGGTADSGTVHFYISDQPNAMDDFAHLNVTVTKVGFHASANGTDDAESDANATSTTANGTTAATTNATTQSTTTATNETTQSTTNATTQSTTNATTTQETDAENETDDSEAPSGWHTQDVESTTIDLTQYRGANATRLANVTLPAGTYDKVFIYVSEVNGTLESGEHVNVKLPSDKLHVNKPVTVGDGDPSQFVFDISVFEAGKSGKYILKPVVSQSGSDVPIEDKTRGKSDDHGKDEEHGKSDDNGRDEEHGKSDDNGKSGDHGPQAESDSPLDATFVGNVTPGQNATLEVTLNGSAVDNATVSVEDGSSGQTTANGTYTFAVPDTDELSVTVSTDQYETTLEREFGDTKERGESDRSDDHPGGGNGKDE